MKKLLHLISFATLLAFNGIAQTTLTLQPDSATGYYDFITDEYPNLAEPAVGEFDAVAWTDHGTPYKLRGLVNFDLSSIPPGAIIQSATLSLYWNPNSVNGSGMHSTLSGSNAAWLQRITSAWNNTTTTWNNQPATTTVDEAVLPMSTSPTENYTIDVTSLVQDMIDSPATSFGMMLMLQTEQYYRSLVFASCNHSDSTLHPKLVVTYTTGCVNLVLQPNSATGYYDYITDEYPTLAQPSCPEFDAVAWTDQGTPYRLRGLVNFDLTSIPAAATIQSASLSLYYNPNSVNGSGMHSTLSGSNASWLQRITSAWNNTTTTWNNQPATTTVDEAVLPMSTSPTENYTVDVTSLIQDMIDSPATSFGMMLMLQTEQYYRSLVFASCNHADSTLRPKLEICYTTVSVVPPVAAFQTNDSIICANDCIGFNDLSTNATSWLWTFNGANPSSSIVQNPQNICYLNSGTFDVSLIVSNSTGSDTVTFSNYIVVSPAPPAPVITQSNDTLFCRSDTSYIAYQWYYNGSAIPGATNAFLIISGGGNYNVAVSNSKGCQTADGIILGLQNYSSDHISVYPNPATNQLAVHVSSFHNEAVTVSVINVLGEIIQVEKLRWSGDININISSLSSGVYFLQIKTANSSVVKKFVKE